MILYNFLRRSYKGGKCKKMGSEYSKLESIKDAIQNSVFCYTNKEGHGFVDKSDCQCYLAGEKNCAAYLEQFEFHRLYSELEKQGLSRIQIIEEIEKRFNWDKTIWIQYNVIK